MTRPIDASSDPAIRPPARGARVEQQLAFALEIDRLRHVLRRNTLADGSRRENTAEHSWHIAMLVIALAEHATPPIDRERALQMALVHDIVEIDAGDTYAFAPHDPQKVDRERAAAERLFGLLPDDDAARLRDAWEEFEALETPEARFVRAIDTLSPLMLNFAGAGTSWLAHGVRASQVRARLAVVEPTLPAVWPHVLLMIDSAVAQGWLIAD